MTLENKLKILSWNICGARYFDLKENGRSNTGEKSREMYFGALNGFLRKLIETHKPHIAAIQEVAEYSESGDYTDRKCIIDVLPDYDYLPSIIVDTIRHPFQNKWNNARQKGGWPTDSYLGQGNAFLVRKDISIFPAASLPAPGISYETYNRVMLADSKILPCAQSLISDVYLDSGLYFGDRDTEPRICSVLHTVIDVCADKPKENIKKPLDVFVLNTHLTTLISERVREAIGRKASGIRMRQLRTIFETIIDRYEEWYNDEFKIRKKHIDPKYVESHNRYPPTWILLGDLNFLPGAEEYEYLINSKRFIDLAKTNRAYTKRSGRNGTPPLTVDYIFVRQAHKYFGESIPYRLSGEGFVLVDSKNPSDHEPVLVELCFEPVE